MLNKQKTREGKGAFAGSRTGDLENNRQEEGSNFLPVSQEKCVRCPNFPGKGYACNLVPCPFTEPGACAACVHFLPVNEHRRKARCVWTGERLDAGEVERERECIGFERREEGLTSAGACGNLISPNHMRRNKRLFCLPKAGKSLVRMSAVEVPAVSSGQLLHIGGVATSSIREDWRPHMSRGALLPRLFLLIPKSYEVPHD